MFKRRQVIQSAAALAAAGMGLSALARGYSCPAGMLTLEVARLLPKPDGLPVVVVLKVSLHGRDGKVVFAEAGEMFPEVVQGLKKFL